MNKKEKIRIIRLLLKQYEKDKNILNSLNQANLYPSINYEDYYQTSSSSKEDYLLHRIQLKQELTKRIIFIEKSHWGKGYGTEVLKSVIREMKKSHLECLYATCDGRNIGAKLMFEKAGFELIDTIKDYRKDIEGNIGDELLYELELD